MASDSGNLGNSSGKLTWTTSIQTLIFQVTLIFDVYITMLQIEQFKNKWWISSNWHLKKNYTDKYFHIVMIQTHLLNTCQLILFKPELYLSENDIKSDYPHHAIIKHRAICWMFRWDSKASTIISYTWFINGYVLASLSRRHVRHTWGDVHYIVVGKNIFLFDFLINTTMFWIKPMKMCSIITSVHMKIFIISIVSFNWSRVLLMQPLSNCYIRQNGKTRIICIVWICKLVSFGLYKQVAGQTGVF